MKFSTFLIFIWLLAPIIIGIAFLIVKRCFTFWTPLLCSVTVGYFLFVASAISRGYELKDELSELDIDGNGTFTNEEITPEVMKRMSAVSSDTGRSYAPFTALPVSAIWATFSLGILTVFVLFVTKLYRLRIS